MRRNIVVACAMCAVAACAGPAAASSAADEAAAAQAPAPSTGGTPPSGGATSSTPRGTLAATPAALLGRVLRFRGTLAGARPGARVVIERWTRAGAWKRTATAVVAADGSFLARWRTDHIGTFSVRALPAAARTDARAASVAPTTRVTVYRAAKATWYGPGFYGRETACGVEYTREVVGVAHRSLPCGTPVALFYRGRSIIVPVVDRGPYANGASWDLTAATARALGFTATDIIGALSLRGRAPLSPPPAPVPVDRSGGTGAPSR